MYGHTTSLIKNYTNFGHGCPNIGYSGLCGQPSSDSDIRILIIQGYVDNPPQTRISGHWLLRAMWTTLLGLGYPDIGHSGLCGQPSSDTDIRTLVTQGYVVNHPQTRISGHWLLRAVWSTLLRYGYLDIGYSGLCGQPSSDSDIRTLVIQGYVIGSGNVEETVSLG